MKKVRLLIWLIIPVVIEKGFAQVDTVKWENDRYTLLSELGKVWIDQYKGSTIKDAKIHYIDTVHGKLTYIKEGTLHDALISNIKMITPGKFYNHCLVLNKKKPIIKDYTESQGYQTGNFTYHETPKFTQPITTNEPEKQLSSDKPIIKTVENTETVENTATQAKANAKIIFENGKQLYVNLITLGANEIKYKRLDLTDGPLYIMSLYIPGSLQMADIRKHNEITIIDYRKQ